MKRRTSYPAVAAAFALFVVGCTPQISGQRVRTVALLEEATPVRLYSLEPWTVPRAGDALFYGRAVLGSMPLAAKDARSVTRAVRRTILTGRDGGPAPECFDPRVATRFARDHQTYDLLLCYQCGNAELFVNGRMLSAFSIGGSSAPLDTLLIAAHVKLSRSWDELRRGEARAAERLRAAHDAWLGALPPHMRAVWTRDGDFEGKDDTAFLMAALREDAPDRDGQIRALLALKATSSAEDSGPDFLYEKDPDAMLALYRREDVVRLALEPGAPGRVREGARRLHLIDAPPP